ncbi:unnamed protein product [Cylindrotheca closterium]|uniref:Uncharacterized protein n=1 Tax=Cylindrotheca closterium TaxID=2856 RepID=A0AAD2FUJ7_9STRA|nr:unnamed protein product [Cylindrotheca closterium]
MNLQHDGFLALIQQSIDMIPTTFNENENPTTALTTTFRHDHSKVLPSLKGNLHKICFQKKRLRASLKHWINSKVLGDCKCVSSHAAYLDRVRGEFQSADKQDEPTQTREASEDHDGETDPIVPNRLKFLDANTVDDFPGIDCIDPDQFLDILNGDVLSLGVIDDKNDTIINPNNLMDSATLLICAARLYRHLLWRKCFLDQLDATTAYGFVVICGQGPGGDDYYLVTHKLQMDLPSFASTSTIGAKVPVQVESHHAGISVSDSQRSALDLLNDLGSFLLTPHRSVMEVNITSLQDNRHLSTSSSFLYPGPVMLLPTDLRRRLQQEEKYPSPQYKVIPTITGSLVIRCINVVAVQELVAINLESNTNSNDSDPIASTDAWYIKCKTALLYGPYWETSKVAINETRRRLQALLKKNKRKTLSNKQIQVAKDWLSMHPFDAIHESHRSVIVVRDMGNVFQGQLCWRDFVAAFESLLEDTLILQNMVQQVHGDIHGGNVLLCHKTSKEHPPKLVLVDWDEAAREKPFHRNAKTEKEKRQYPAALINFPDLYTKHQLQELFEYYINKYYTESGYAEAWLKFQQERGTFIEQGFQVFVRHHHKILGAFLASASSGNIER